MCTTTSKPASVRPTVAWARITVGRDLTTETIA
jgi:hypothetical protein